MHSERAMSLFCHTFGRSESEAKRECTESFHADWIKGLTGFLQPRKLSSLFNPLMKRRAILHILIFFVVGSMFAQDAVPTSTPARRRGWLGRLLHPFSPDAVPQYKDARLRGLTVDLQITPQTIKLSEVRQLGIKLTLANVSKRPVTLDFPTNQRIEIYLMNSEGNILTKWSDNHAIAEKPVTILINPQERIEYNETIATRDLTPNKVFIAEVFFPQYPELRIRQKFLAVP
jgi:Intracellular proteinase inhibitor